MNNAVNDEKRSAVVAGTNHNVWRAYILVSTVHGLSLGSISIVIMASLFYWFSSPMHHQLLGYLLGVAYVFFLLSSINSAYRRYRREAPTLDVAGDRIILHAGDVGHQVLLEDIKKIKISKMFFIFRAVALTTTKGNKLVIVGLDNIEAVETVLTNKLA